MSRRAAVKPMVAIIGTTGTGKSQLAVDLARRFNGEIVNADAMQLYRGLPVITNKITEEEQHGVPHHLLGCVEPHEQPWRVDRFIARALEVVEGIHARQRLPILVGGTHYYIQSLLFPDASTLSTGTAPNRDDGLSKTTLENDSYATLLNESTEALMARLRAVDPVMANRWHPHERRKIKRSLEIYLQTGRRPSELYAEQAASSNVNGATGKKLPAAPDHADELLSVEVDAAAATTNTMQFPTLILWTHTERDILFQRLNDRVDRMLEFGLLREVEQLNCILHSSTSAGQPIDQTSGIWVSIGYRQLQGYVSSLQDANCGTDELGVALADAIDRTKIATRHYAKSQLKWIRIKLANALRCADALSALSLLDTSRPEAWQTEVLAPATKLTEALINGHDLEPVGHSSAVAQRLLHDSQPYDLSQRRDLWTTHKCATCDMTVVTDKQWNIHLQSKRHKQAMKRQRTTKTCHDARPP
ncbi:MAG: hypothetical protein M1828_005819 [Chrysothrix sp. TS-e1954]|nr:MAG: hypothetical protein M1828_005819 [Chrysothrix sp. TS-e1954]